MQDLRLSGDESARLQAALKEVSGKVEACLDQWLPTLQGLPGDRVSCKAGGKLTVNGVVRQLDEWYEAFGVKPGDAMYLPPEKRVRIW